MGILLAELHTPWSLSPWSQGLRLSFIRLLLGSHPLPCKAPLILLLPPASIILIRQDRICAAWLGKEVKWQLRTQCD